jgi:hypothetical protein
MTREQALSVMQEVFNSMKASGMFDENSNLDPDTVILGVGSNFDSLGFVTFISDLEERVSDIVGDEVYLVLTDINDLNINNPFLSAGTVAQYIENITQG